MVLSIKTAVNRNSKILALFAIACTAIVGLIHSLTKDQIVFQQQQDLLRNLNSIITEDSYNNVIYRDCYILSGAALGTVDSQKVYRARNNKNPIAAAITTVAPDGYSGNIELLIAININGSVSGVRTLKHQETPGLGDKIEVRKSDWIKSFNTQKLANKNDSRWLVKKDGGMFDQFTGATITPRAVVRAVKNTVIYFNEHKDKIFESESNCQNTDSVKEALPS
ncbi:MAG: electron transport complex subunit RsxG [Alteromonadaceae bacterium]